MLGASSLSVPSLVVFGFMDESLGPGASEVLPGKFWVDVCRVVRFLTVTMSYVKYAHSKTNTIATMDNLLKFFILLCIATF